MNIKSNEKPKRIRDVCQFCKGLKPMKNELRLCKTVGLQAGKRKQGRIYLPKELIGKQVEIVFSRDDLKSLKKK
jgi:hypothetical protein